MMDVQLRLDYLLKYIDKLDEYEFWEDCYHKIALNAVSELSKLLDKSFEAQNESIRNKYD